MSGKLKAASARLAQDLGFLDRGSVVSHPSAPTHAQNAVSAGGKSSVLHVGVIMDGNGRWAAARGLPRYEGHRRGVEALRKAVRAAGEFGVRYLTVYSFSSENWSRPQQEVAELMGLLKTFIRNDLQGLYEAGVRVRVIGAREGLETDIVELLEEAEDLKQNNDKLDLIVAFNYGARQEIVEAAQALAREVVAGRLKPENIDENCLRAHLQTASLPDPDVIIRTSGEMRLSNFLMWQAAYAELIFLPIFWPDFDRQAFGTALDMFRARERRFGGL